LKRLAVHSVGSFHPLITNIRNYRPGDEELLVALWNLAYADYAGYVKRTAAHWRWCILERPGIDTADIIILEKGGDVLGYGILGLNGTVLELAVDPRLSAGRREKVAGRVNIALEERSRTRGDEMISFEVPQIDEAICRALRRAGYREETSESLNMAIIDPVGLIRKILAHRGTRISPGWSPSFLLEVMPGHYRFCPYRRVHIQNGSPVAVTADPINAMADYIVGIALSTLTDLIFRRTTFESALKAGRITVQPISGLQDVATLINLLIIDKPWYTPHADGR